MREIIFRGKRLDNGEWIFGGALHQTDYYGENVDSWYIIDGTCTNDYDIGYSYAVGPSTIGQYTGRQCKNGKVFDGDIGKNIDGVFLVCWDEEKAAFVMRFLEYPFEKLYLEEMYDDTEIIGNIHDNPELLLESKEECNT